MAKEYISGLVQGTLNRLLGKEKIDVQKAEDEMVLVGYVTGRLAEIFDGQIGEVNAPRHGENILDVLKRELERTGDSEQNIAKRLVLKIEPKIMANKPLFDKYASAIVGIFNDLLMPPSEHK